MSTIPPRPYINHQYDSERLVMDLCQVSGDAILATGRFFEDAATKLHQRHKLRLRDQAEIKGTKGVSASMQRVPERVFDRMMNGHSGI